MGTSPLFRLVSTTSRPASRSGGRARSWRGGRRRPRWRRRGTPLRTPGQSPSTPRPRRSSQGGSGHSRPIGLGRRPGVVRATGRSSQGRRTRLPRPRCQIPSLALANPDATPSCEPTHTGRLGCSRPFDDPRQAHQPAVEAVHAGSEDMVHTVMYVLVIQPRRPGLVYAGAYSASVRRDTCLVVYGHWVNHCIVALVFLCRSNDN
jgi:hypothetical protein